ncbi:GDSL-type esterase/lipase family protein [Paenibacillus sp. 1P07SE]|uniref:GDSL-type esterase/lipase family protein n=1 Tax=Paenibacillus sp. 1P07SE TaxID=3132209 RepID=UPI0039A40A2F
MSQWQRVWYASQASFDDRFFGQTLSHVSFENQTIRMVVHPHAYGTLWRLKFSNLYGTYPLTLDNVTLASQRNNQLIEDQTIVDVTFEGMSKVVIAVGAEVYSDNIMFHADPNADIAISLFTPIYTNASTWHFSPARSTYIAEGEKTKANDAALFDTTIHSYYWLTALDVMMEADPALFIAMGDSITEGYASSLNTNNRWPDLLQQRFLQANPNQQLTILNAGLSGNMILRDARHIEFGASLGLANAGERMLDRLERDGLSQPGLNGIIFHGGINDIFGDITAEQLIEGIKELADRVNRKQQQINMAIATITPFGGSAYFTKEREQVRQKVNQWIRANTNFDLVIDLDQTLTDPQNPSQLLHTYDYGDKAHPNDEGNRAIANAIPLSFLNKN